MNERVDETHPTSEEWVAYLYGEIDSATREALTDHLFRCARCREDLARWRGVMFALDTWTLEERPVESNRRRWRVAPFAAAASFVLVLFGFGIGRFFAPKPVDVSALRAEIAEDVRVALEGELRDALYRELTEDWQSGVAAAQRQVYLDLRRDLAERIDAATRRLIETSRRDSAEMLASVLEVHERRDAELYAAIQRVDDARRNDLADLEARIGELAAVTSAEIMKTRTQWATWTPPYVVSSASVR